MTIKLKRLAAQYPNVQNAVDAIAKLAKIEPDELRDVVETARLSRRESRSLFSLATAAGVYMQELFERRCRVCGCTQDNCERCFEKTGDSCHWVEEDLCSACLPGAEAKSPGSLT